MPMRLPGSLVAACAVGAAAIHQSNIQNSNSVTSAALGVLDSIDEVMQQHNSKTFEVAGAFMQEGVTPGVTDSLNSALSATVKQIAAKVDEPIKAAHSKAQKAINAALADLRQGAAAVMKQKTAADQADHAHWECVDEERGLLQTAESADDAHQSAQAARVEPCKLQEKYTKMAVDVPAAGFSFDCEHSTDGLCDARYAAFQEHGQSELAKLKVSVQKNSELYAEAKLACEAAHADVAAKKKAHEQAVKDWTTQRSRCASLAADRQKSICSFGTAMQGKCVTKLPQFESIVKRVKAQGNAESHPDRVQEWTTAHIAKCMLSGVVRGATADKALLASCMKSVDYESGVGQINYQEAAKASLLSPKQFTCAAGQSISFKGSTWDSGKAAESSDYKTVQFAAKLSLKAGTPPFDFCPQ